MSTTALAEMIPTDELVSTAGIELKRDEIRSILMRDDIRSFMNENGVSSENASQRLNNLSSSEVIAMHQQLNNLPAGQGALGAVVLILVIFILLDVAGVTDIFPGV
tara:strand:+ start:3218 stop:3535 length:318 start_codon:yes stop_codon:yes gene_type:complete